jgi:hypothetical protein
MPGARTQAEDDVMASVRICLSCGHENLLDGYPLCSRCGTSLATVSRTEKTESVMEARPARQAAQALESPSKNGGRAPARTCPICGEPGEPGQERCIKHQMVLVSSANLATANKVVIEGWPWGGSEEVSEPLRVGRLETFSRLAARLAKYDNISGRHAEFFLHDGVLFIKDVGSTNGTFVDDIRIPVEKPERIGDSTRVRFAANNWSVTARIRNGV